MFTERVAKLVFSFVVILFVNACIAPEGFQRTPFLKWEVKKIHTLGLKIELPKESSKLSERYHLTIVDSPAEYIEKIKCKALHIQMHPLWSGSLLTEPYYILKIDIVRMSKQSFEDFKKDRHRANGYFKFNEPRFFKGTARKLVAGHVQSEKGLFLCFRRDVRALNGDIIVSGAELLTNLDEYPPDQQVEDIRFIERILNSVTPI